MGRLNFSSDGFKDVGRGISLLKREMIMLEVAFMFLVLAVVGVIILNKLPTINGK
jgi:hypothetical protein